MPSLGITIMLILAATAYAGAQNYGRPCNTQARALRAQDGQP